MVLCSRDKEPQKKCGKKNHKKKLYKNPKKGLTTSKDYGIIYIEEGISRNRRLLPPPPYSPRLQRAAHAGACDMRIVNTKKIPPKKLKKYKKIRSYYFFLYYSLFFLIVYFFFDCFIIKSFYCLFFYNTICFFCLLIALVSLFFYHIL